MEELPALEDDGLITPEIGAWGEEKYRLVALYASLFAKSMRKKWDCLVYIDLFAGAGRALIRKRKHIIPASPLVVLGLPERFDRYIFCERDTAKLAALKERIARGYPKSLVHIIAGDANERVADILGAIATPSKDFRVLAFCFVDPYALNNLQSSTIEALSQRYMDFLVLIPSGMDAHRFESVYVKPNNKTIDRFLGDPGWREA